eukprot:16441140-Heterocapsa_arctica.AAC.1
MDVGRGLAGAEVFEGVPIDWIIDTGSGNYLAGRGELPSALQDAIVQSNCKLRLATANGIVSVKSK